MTTATIVLLYTGDGLVSDITDQAAALKTQGYQISSGTARKGTPYLIAKPAVQIITHKAAQA